MAKKMGMKEPWGRERGIIRPGGRRGKEKKVRETKTRVRV